MLLFRCVRQERNYKYRRSLALRLAMPLSAAAAASRTDGDPWPALPTTGLYGVYCGSRMHAIRTSICKILAGVGLETDSRMMFRRARS